MSSKTECRVRKESGELLTNCVKKLDDREKLESTYERLVELIKRDLERDPAAEELPENEKVRQKIIEGQQKRGKTSKEIFHESAGWRHLGRFSNSDWPILIDQFGVI